MRRVHPVWHPVWHPLWIALCLAIPWSSACDRSVAGGAADGARIFAEACARCHGERGVPPPEMALQYRVPDLGSAELQGRLDAAQMRERIARGKNAMPAFQDVLTAAQLDAVAGFVKTLGATDGPSR